MANKIRIVVNGMTEDVPEGSTVLSLIRHFNELDHHLIVEHNNRFVYPHKYGETVIYENDKLEFINPNVGG
jgi:thiamine biosynthesis protein ThiS